MRKIFTAILIVALVTIVVLVGISKKEDAGTNVPEQKRTLTPEQLLSRVRLLNKPLRLRTSMDVLPGGYAAAMAPVMIDWQSNRPWDEHGFVIIHNLNHGGNPVDGTTVFCSARVPLDGVEAVEFILLPLDKIGREGLLQHGQLRFVFAANRPVELLNYGNEKMGSDCYLYDLVFSWEAWRPPDTSYDFKTGMNPAAYLLTPRCFSGPTRFLDDALGQRDWISYRLRLPHGRLGFAELLKTNLALCDGVARHNVSKILKQSEEKWAQQAPRVEENQTEPLDEWEYLRKVVAPNTLTTDPLINLLDDDLAYQTLLRSCAIMSLYTINVAVDRLAAAGHTDGLNPDYRMLPDLGHQEPWMTELAGTDLKGIFLRAPAILRFLWSNPQAFPKNIPHQLEHAGLLELENGKVKKIRYQLDGITPYGTLQENLIK
jgi:hypothetical protein